LTNAELQSGFCSLASTAMVDPKGETERLESHCCTKFSDLESWQKRWLRSPGLINNARSNLEPFKFALVKTELEGRVNRRLLSRV
jgi:hypothetical protein